MSSTSPGDWLSSKGWRYEKLPSLGADASNVRSARRSTATHWLKRRALFPESGLRNRFPSVFRDLQPHSGRHEVRKIRISRQMRGHLKVCALKHANSDKTRTLGYATSLRRLLDVLRGRKPSTAIAACSHR